MDKDKVLTHILRAKGVPTLLGGDLPVNVISNNYISPLTSTEQQVSGRNVQSSPSPSDQAIHTLLPGGGETVILVGSEGSGKTTALQKLLVDWSKGEHLQHFSYVFYLKLSEINLLDGMLTLEALLHLQHGYLPPLSVSLCQQKPEDVLFIFDELDQYKHSVDPSDHSLCSDPSQATSVSCLVASLLHGSLLKGASCLVASRPTACLKFLSGSQVKVLGFLKPEREAFFKGFFTDPAVANNALMHMEKTLGFYDFCTSPRFCWTVCSVYKLLTDSGEKLPDTLSQLFVQILACLIQKLTLKKELIRDIVLALSRMASHCAVGQHSSCTKEEMNSFGFEPALASQAQVNAFLQVHGDPESDRCGFSFHSQLIQDFILAVSFFLDKSTSEGADNMLKKHKHHAKFLDIFMSALSEPIQRRPLETLLGEFNSDLVLDFRCWLNHMCETTLQDFNEQKHCHCFHLLYQMQNEHLVKEIINPSTRFGISYANLNLQDYVALNYVVTQLGETEQLNLYGAQNLTEEIAEILAPAMTLSHKIQLSQCSLSDGAVSHLASALAKGITRKLNLNNTRLGDAQFRSLCTGLRDCKLHKLNLRACKLTEASCGYLASVLMSGTSQLCVLDLSCNDIGDQGMRKLCQGLRSPHCKLQDIELQWCLFTAASMEDLSTALCSGQSQLRKLNLSRNPTGDSGMKALCKCLQHPHCKLQSLTLFDNELTGACCAHIMEALMSEHCPLLDLSVNEIDHEGALLLCKALKRPGCPVEKLCMVGCGLTEEVFIELASLLRHGSPPLKSLSVPVNKVGDKGLKHLWEAIAYPSCLLEELDVDLTGLTDACVEDMCAAIRASKTMRSVVLSNNLLTDASVPVLVQLMQDSPNMQEMNLKYNDFSEDVFEMMDECEKIRY
ncbi:NACHT, LRR and PYD domains-containing protein 3 isoform X2 [Sphaeramia orbicularis]|nr:NACHT, LRR and PYD domains-containing protein 3-like isoform X2 [Sphaeramia orbicularis]